MISPFKLKKKDKEYIMPRNQFIFWPVLALALGAVASALAAPGMITTSLSSMGPVLVGETVTATFRISGYTDVTEIDGFTFKVSFPGSIFMYIGGVEAGTEAGPDQQWLSKPAQDDGFMLTIPNPADDPGFEPGMVPITAFDFGSGDIFTGDKSGTLAESGFLVSFNLLTKGMGEGNITLSPVGGEVLLGLDLVPAGVPTLVGANITVVPEPGTVALLVTGGIALLVLRYKRRGQV